MCINCGGPEARHNLDNYNLASLAVRAASARIDGTRLIVDPGEPRFGTVTLDITEAKAWADAINRLNRPQDA